MALLDTKLLIAIRSCFAWKLKIDCMLRKSILDWAFCNFLEISKCWIWLTNELLAKFNHNRKNQSYYFIHGSKVQKSISINFLIGATKPNYTYVTPTHWWLLYKRSFSKCACFVLHLKFGQNIPKLIQNFSFLIF
jgi:hypothetical protein